MGATISAIFHLLARGGHGKARTSIPLLAALLSSACVTVPEPAPDRETPALDGVLDPRAVIEHGVDDETVVALWKRSEEARREGDTAAAIGAIERALEMAPDDPVLMSRLAELHLHAREGAAAENLAIRSNSMVADGHRLLRYRNWLIIEAARRAQGDAEGADAARREIERLRAGR